MARTKEEKAAAEQAEQIVEEKVVEEKVVEEIQQEPVKQEVKAQSETTAKTGPSYDELISLVQQLSQEVATLKYGNQNNSNAGVTDILAALANRKSDREVSITHNCELNGSLTTHIDLSNISIDFKRIGETRLLSWQQFEECASKYRSFFERGIILVSAEYEEIAAQYNLPCEKRKDNKHLLTHKDIEALPTLSVPELEKFISTLSKADKDTVFSYWLGKCYTREPAFYDRYKMDTLNRLSEGSFDTVLLVMNGEERDKYYE